MGIELAVVFGNGNDDVILNTGIVELVVSVAAVVMVLC